MLNKVPEVTLYFWIIKVMCTTVGETAADFLNTHLNLGLTGTSLVMGSLLIVALFFQFKARKYIPGIYWLAVVLISVVGTLITDNLVDNFGISLKITTTIFGICPGGDLRRLVRQREDAVDPQHLHDPAGSLLLADHPVHLRAWVPRPVTSWPNHSISATGSRPSCSAP